MRRFPLLIGLALLAGPAQAQDEAAGGHVVEVRLSSFEFTPREIVLPARRAVTLRLVNTGGGGHNFAAPQFFRTARMQDGQRRRLANGAVEVPGRQSVTITLVAEPGNYPLRCTHTFHTALGMRGSIVVR